MESFDVIVAGLGAMGSAIAMHLARRGLRVAGFDRHRPPHALGSSHGGSRIIREAYFEHPVYVPIVQRAYDLWAELERATSTPLYLRTGGLMLGEPGSVLVEGALASAREHRLEHRVLDARSIRDTFPALNPPDAMVGVLEPRAGVLFPERAIAAQLAEAERAGASIRCEEPVEEWVHEGHGVRARTRCGEIRARHLVAAAGAWMPSLLPGSTLALEVERQTLFWFQPARNGDAFAPSRCPIHLWQFDRGEFYYGFPDLGEGVKVARHHHGARASAEGIDRAVSNAEVDDIRTLVRRFTPDADGALLSSAVCMYTNTPDEHFRIDWIDGERRVLVVSACSGHGFKFAPAIGEIAADLLTGREPRFDLGLFRLRSRMEMTQPAGG